MPAIFPHEEEMKCKGKKKGQEKIKTKGNRKGGKGNPRLKEYEIRRNSEQNKKKERPEQ